MLEMKNITKIYNPGTGAGDLPVPRFFPHN